MVCSMLPRMAAMALPQRLPNSAESAGPGLGTRFTFMLSVAGEAAVGAASGPFESTLRSPRQGQEPARVLVVDEDPEMLRSVRHELAAAGYVIVPCLRERAMEPLQDVFGNAHGYPFGGFPHRVAREMRIARGRFDSAVTEQPADDRQSLAKRQRPGRK